METSREVGRKEGEEERWDKSQRKESEKEGLQGL